jgi:hypothetical protein
MTPSRINCSDAHGRPVRPRCRICQMKDLLEDIDAMFEWGCTCEEIADFIAASEQLALDVTVESVRNHALRLDSIRHPRGDSSGIFPS